MYHFKFRVLYLAVVLMSGISAQGFAQGNIDSLEKALNNSGQDTIRINLLLDLGAAHGYTIEKSLPYFKDAQELSHTLSLPVFEGYAYKLMGAVHYYTSGFDTCLLYWNKSLELYAQAGEMQYVANSHNNIGNVYMDQMCRFLILNC